MYIMYIEGFYGEKRMRKNLNILFEQRILVAQKLKEILREKGFTKVSFAKKTDISRPTLDRILNGENDSKSTFDKHMQKILEVLEMTPSELLSFDSTSNTKTVDAVYSQNAPADYSMDKNAKHQYDLLLDVVELCKIYY